MDELQVGGYLDLKQQWENLRWIPEVLQNKYVFSLVWFGLFNEISTVYRKFETEIWLIYELL